MVTGRQIPSPIWSISAGYPSRLVKFFSNSSDIRRISSGWRTGFARRLLAYIILYFIYLLRQFDWSHACKSLTRLFAVLFPLIHAIHMPLRQTNICKNELHNNYQKQCSEELEVLSELINIYISYRQTDKL